MVEAGNWLVDGRGRTAWRGSREACWLAGGRESRITARACAGGARHGHTQDGARRRPGARRVIVNGRQRCSFFSFSFVRSRFLFVVCVWFVLVLCFCGSGVVVVLASCSGSGCFAIVRVWFVLVLGLVGFVPCLFVFLLFVFFVR